MGMAPWRREVSEIVAFLTDCRWVQSEGGRDVLREVTLYNLDAIIAVGYRVKSYQATQFRIWATNTVREFMIKGFVIDDERLKHGNAVCARARLSRRGRRASASAQVRR